ncbi:hypothetical protein [Bacteriovorax sp. Seq25_V]|uniref:hypothetical protein n=1 Tax=Bacteriovorax sp. Seq25_V TaxID=1201288 RepID=UPI000389E3A5|nr:hypothetical protein [Bacteriovorax sp. Seq25_V]EQC43891.1 hypothetical protein M900_1187 [Bacteriovorax sp. Seq25_V]
MKLLLISFITLSTLATEYTTSIYSSFLKLENVEFERAYLMDGKINRGKVVRATNDEDFPVCIVSLITEGHNIKNEFFNNGKVIIQPGRTEPLGGFTQINPRKSWNAKWVHIRRKKISSCN